MQPQRTLAKYAVRRGGELLALAAIYYFINFVLTTNGFFPVHADDLSSLGLGVADMGWWWKRPVSSNVIFLVVEQGRVFAYLMLNGLAVFTAWQVLRFAAGVFDTEFSLASVLAFGVLTFSHSAAFEHGKYFGLMTNLVSHVFGLWTLLLLWHGWHRHSERSWWLALLAYASSVFAKEDFILPPLCLIAFFWIGQFGQELPVRQWRLRLYVISAAFIAVGVGSLLWGIFDRSPYVVGLLSPAGGERAYAVDLSFASLLKGYAKLLLGYAPVPTALAGMACLGLWILRPATHLRLALYLVLIATLILPYAMLPNNMPAYRVYAWLPWMVAVTVLAMQALVLRHRSANAFGHRARLGAIGMALALVLCVAWVNGTDRMRLASKYQASETINRNIAKALEENRARVSHAQVVGLHGLGVISLWCANDALYVNNKLGFSNRWLIFVDSESRCYSSRVPDKKKKRGINVSVAPAQRLCEFGALPVLDFAADGSAVLKRASDWCD